MDLCWNTGGGLCKEHIRCQDRVLSTGGGGGGGGREELLPQTPKLPPQNLVTDLWHPTDFWSKLHQI